MYDFSGVKIGFVMTGSFCSFAAVFRVLEELRAANAQILPVMSEHAAGISTRFGTAEEMRTRLEEIAGCKAIYTIADAEPIGPKNLTDVMVVAPCTGNTIAKLAQSITDTAATMAVKSHLRNAKPVVIAVATNDALAGTAKNLGALMNLRNYFFVPLGQDQPERKPTSLVADFARLPQTIHEALSGQQVQPVWAAQGAQ